MWFLYLLCIIIALIIDYVIAKKFADIAEMKGHEGNTYFWFTFLLGVVGMLMVIALPNTKAITIKTLPDKQPAPVPKKEVVAPTQRPTHTWRCDGCGNVRSQTPCEHCGRNENETKAPYQCGKCGQTGPYDGNCPTCGSSIKLYNH